jgi:hypothetical protein
MADTSEAYILETAGRKWAVRQIESIGSFPTYWAFSATGSAVQKAAHQAAWTGRKPLPFLKYANAGVAAAATG